MPLDKTAIDELKANVAFARKRELAFGLCIGKSAETTVLACHKTKAPDAMGRQAKKDGETAKIAFGMMTVEGKNLNLSCEGDVPSGLARKTREMLKVVGLKLKVRILDSTGVAIEEDGDEEDDDPEIVEDGGAAADPLAEDWAKARAETGAAVTAASELPGAEAIARDWQSALDLAENEDLEGALKAAGEVMTAIGVAEETATQRDADRLRWETAAAKIAPLVEATIATGTPSSSKVSAVWAFAKGKAEGAEPDYGAAIKSITMIVKLIQDSRSEEADTAPMAAGNSGRTVKSTPPSAKPGPSAPDGGTATATQPPLRPTTAAPQPPTNPPSNQAAPVEPGTPPGPSASDKEKFDYAEAQLKAIDTLISEYMAVIPGSGEAIPVSWTGAKGKIDAVLAPMRGPGAAINAKKVADAQKGIDTVIGVISGKIVEKTTWKQTLDLMNLRLVPLERHVEAGSSPEVAPKIAAIKAEIGKAVVKANAQDFKSATSLVAPLTARCDTVEKLADDFSHYKVILAQRQAAVGVAAGAPTGVKDVDKLQKAIEKLLSNAQKLAGREKFAEAVKNLDQIPAIHDQYRRLADQASDYTSSMANIESWIPDFDGRAPAARAGVQAELDQWKKDVAAAKVTKTKDYGVSMRMLSTLWGKQAYLKNAFITAEAYLAALKDFEMQFATFKAHKGRSGIEAFYLQMERDLAQAKAEAASGKHSTATAILNRTQPQWATQEAKADACEQYVTKRDAVAQVISGLKGNAAAATVLAQAEGLMATAVTQSVAGDFTTAKASVEEAERRAGNAKAAADAQGDLGKLKDSGALGGIAADIDRAIKVYDDMRTNVAGKITGGGFADLLALADTEAQKARDEKAKPAPDFGVAKGGLDAGIARLEAALPKILAKAPFDTHLAEAKNLTAALVALNVDNCIQPQMVAANALITEAENLGKPPGYDFPGAEAKLVPARAGAEKAKADAALWPQIKADRATIDGRKTAINAVPAAAALMGPTLTRLNDALNGIDTKKAAGDFKGAAKQAADGAVASARMAKDLVTVQTIIARYATRYTARVGQVTGPDSAKAQSQVDLMNTKHGEYTTALAAGNYDAALRLVYETGWAIDAALRILGEHTTYEVARAAAEAKLNSLRAVRNLGVEDEVKALEKRYDDAVILSTVEKHLPAQKAMEALPVDCDTLIAKAGLWKGYDDALTAAQAKLATMESHPQAAAIRPMITALRGKFTAAVSTAGKGDFSGAKTLLDQIPAEADAALTTAAAAAGVADKAGKLGDEAPDPALLAEATKLYDGLVARAEAPSAKADLDLARQQLDVAGSKVVTPEGAQQALKAAMEACTRADMTISQQKMVADAVAAAQAATATLKTHAQAAYIAIEIAAMEAEAKAVLADTAKSGPDAAGNRVRTLNERVAQAKVLADGQAKYVAVLAEADVQPRLAQLEAHAHRYAIKPSIDTIRKKLEEAAARSADKKPVEALALLEEVRAIGTSAFVMAEMRANANVNVADVKKILGRPGGQAELDAMIDQLEPDAQRKVIRVAFEARFGCKLENFSGVDAAGKPTGPVLDGALDGPNIKRFYEIMSKLPDGHVVDSDSMRKFTNIESGGGSYYADTDKDVVMREGDAVLSGAYGFGREHEVGGADEDCKPVDDKEVSFFSWNTLHEVGHAVDDKNGFMNKNQSGAAYGGWTFFGQNTQAIAKAIEGHFKYDATYMGQFLTRATPAVPPAPAGTDPEQWESRRVAFEAWAATTFVGGKPWSSNSTAAKIAIGGTVYQESYDFTWTGYALAARKQGMTGYQFRAPGEWFAELYAAYHSGKLKPTHPSAGWLAAL